LAYFLSPSLQSWFAVEKKPKDASLLLTKRKKAKAIFQTHAPHWHAAFPDPEWLACPAKQFVLNNSLI
jgi:hypothetical protein